MREAVQTLPVSLTPDAVNAVEDAMTGLSSQLLAVSAILDVAQATRDAHPKWELHTIEVEGVTLQMRRKDGNCARFVVTID